MDARAYVCSDGQEDHTSAKIPQVEARHAQMGDAGTATTIKGRDEETSGNAKGRCDGSHCTRTTTDVLCR